MAINGTGVNEAIAVVLKAAKAVAGIKDQLSKNTSDKKMSSVHQICLVIKLCFERNLPQIEVSNITIMEKCRP